MSFWVNFFCFPPFRSSLILFEFQSNMINSFFFACRKFSLWPIKLCRLHKILDFDILPRLRYQSSHFWYVCHSIWRPSKSDFAFHQLIWIILICQVITCQIETNHEEPASNWSDFFVWRFLHRIILRLERAFNLDPNLCSFKFKELTESVKITK